MSNPIATGTPVRQPDAAPADSAKTNPPSHSLGAKQTEVRAHLNRDIAEASLAVSINAKNEPLALLFKTAIESLNETLKADFGENAIQNAVGQDNTPEGTAGRIVSLSTAFFEAYKQQHPGQDQDTLLNSFIATITRGFERGFNEAKSILSGLKVLNGEIESNINKTYELVLKGYADFTAQHTSATKQGAPAAA